MQQQPQNPNSTLMYRVEMVEKDIIQLKSQLNIYEPIRENELKLSGIKDIVSRTEVDLQKVKEKVEAINTRMVISEQEQKDNQAKLQIRTLWYIVSTVITILSALLVGYLTHIIH